MSNPSTTPCPWPMISCTGESGDSGAACPHLANLPDAVQDAVIQSATEFLWNATGRRFGSCVVTVRPCKEGCWDSSTYRGWSGAPAGGYYGYGYGQYWVATPYIWGGNWYNLACGGCNAGHCDTSHMDWLKLPGPVVEVLEVYIDGALFNDWVYDNWGLGRTDGERWPRQQDQAALLTENNTFGVTYERGVPVPSGGQLALGTLACELAKASCGDGSCRLPKRISNITREGVSMSFVDDFGSLMNPGHGGPLTGIWAIDQWIASVNYQGRRRTRVLAPGARQDRFTR